MQVMTADRDPNTVGVFFDDLGSANQAIQRLVSAGISRTKVQLLSGPDALAYADDNRPGFWGAVASFFFADNDRRFLLQKLRRGGYLLLVADLDLDEDEIALDILDDDGDTTNHEERGR